MLKADVFVSADTRQCETAACAGLRVEACSLPVLTDISPSLVVMARHLPGLAKHNQDIVEPEHPSGNCKRFLSIDIATSYLNGIGFRRV